MSAADLRSRALRALVPPPRISLPDWIESNVRLPEDVSALPGPMRLYAYQRGMAEAIGDPGIERVTVLKAARVGYSSLLTGCLGAYVANDPCPVIVLLPTESDCRDFVVSTLDPTFGASPALRGALADEADESGRSTLLHRRFPGGSLRIVAAKSPRNLRARTARILLMDETDAMTMTPEGSPITLAEKRTLSFPDRKIIQGSTPTDELTSNVWRAWQESDQRVYKVPCPECGAFFEILWACIEWPEGEPDKAACRCPHCESVIDERHKASMVSQGHWEAQRPDVKGHAGFRLSALVSTLANASWGKLAAEFIAAKKSPDTLRVFVNTVLGEIWREAADEIDESELAARAEPVSLEAIPAEVLVLTAGTDVQRDRLETTVTGWTAEGVMIALAHHVVWGSPDSNDTWTELDDFLKASWKHPLGGSLRIDAAAVDAGDGETMDKVLAFTKPRLARRVVAIKGAAGQRPAIQSSKGKHALWIVGVDGLKAQLLARLAKPGLVRFSEALGAEWFSQLASERRVVRYRFGRPVPVFERIPGRRAEALDSVIYAMAVRGLVKADLVRRENELRAIVSPAVLPAVIRSAWLDR